MKAFCHLPSRAQLWGLALITQQHACLFIRLSPPQDFKVCEVKAGSLSFLQHCDLRHTAWHPGAKWAISKWTRTHCIILRYQCFMKKWRLLTTPPPSSTCKFSTYFHQVLLYMPWMPRCILGTLSSNKWWHHDNHGKSMMKQENDILLLAWVK